MLFPVLSSSPTLVLLYSVQMHYSCTNALCSEYLLLYYCTLSISPPLELLYFSSSPPLVPLNSVQITYSCTIVLCPVHLLAYFTLYFALAAAGAADQSGSSGISPKLTLSQLDTS